MGEKALVKVEKELAKKAKDLGANLSRITSLALEDYIRRNQCA